MPEFITKLKEYPWRKNIKRLLFETPVEIMIGVVLVGAITGTLGYRNRAARAGEIPIAFSEVEQITKDFNKAGKAVPPLTKFYAVNNDVPMKVFESNNIALAVGKSHLIFATELRTRVDANFKTHPLISTYAEEMPQDAQAALGSLDKLATAAKGLPSIDAAFSKVWGESHYDVTHTRHWTTRDCDSNGKNCHTTSHSETVYDYTIHTYTYHADAGRRAAQLLDAFIAGNPDLTINERLYLANETHAENQQAIKTSMKRALEGKTPTDEQYLKYANTWASGSNFVKYSPGIANTYGALRSVAADWDKALGTAQNHRYITYSHFDSGPREYQIAEAEQSKGNAIVNDSREILNGIGFSERAVTQLDGMIKEYVGVVLDHKPGDPDRLRSDIMQTARDIYQKNYENGFDVQPFKWLDVVLFTLLGMAIGGAAGFGVDRFLDSKKEDWYDHDGENDNRRDPDEEFNRPRRRTIPEWQPAPEARTEPQEPAAPPDLKDLPPPSWTPKPPKGVEVSAPLPPREPKPEPQVQASESSPANDTGPRDDKPRDAKWVKKYKDLQP